MNKDTTPVNNPLPKRKAGRPRLSESEKLARKVARTKRAVVIAPKSSIVYQDPKRVQLHVPTLPLVAKARKMAWLIQNIEKHLLTDPTYISPKEYFSLLKDMEAVYTQLNKERLGTSEQRREARERAKSGGLAENGNEERSSRMGEDKPAGVDARVSTKNPLGAKG